MSKERFLELLVQHELVRPHVLEAFRQQIAGLPESTSAAEIVSFLVSHHVLTSQKGEAALRLWGRESAAFLESVVPPSQYGDRRPDKQDRLIVPPPPPLKNEHFLPENPLNPVSSASPVLPAHPVESPPVSDEQPFSPPWRGRRARFSRKKKASNPWDSKLILFGAGGLLVLVLLGFFLFGSLFRRSADALFSKADSAYQNASYGEAIIDYTAFLDAYPSHTEASTAKIRRALARIRVLVDAGTDWTKSLETAETEIKSIEGEPRFFEESNAELANLLPAIAMGLAGEADEKTSVPHAKKAEETLELIEKVLPRSLRPTDKLAEVQYRIDEVRRRFVQGNMLDEAKRDLDRKLVAEKFDLRQMELSYDMIDRILADHPELANDSRLTEMYRKVSENESRAVTVLPGDELPRPMTVPEEKTLPAEALPVEEVAIPFQRSVRTKPSSLTDDPVFLYAGGAVYGLEAADATPLWKRRVGDVPPESIVSPMFLSLPKTRINPNGGVVLPNTRDRALDQRDPRTGKLLWRLPIDESFYLSELTVSGDRVCLGIATRSGKLLTVDFASVEGDETPKNEIRGVRLPQELTSAPLVDLVENKVYQFAGKNTFYTLSYPMPTQTEPAPPEAFVSRYFGQRPSTIRISPFRFANRLIVIRQRDAGSCVMDVFSAEKGIEQSIPLRGLVDTRPAVDGRYLALTTDSGETCLFERSDNPRVPLRQIAQGSAGGEARREGTLRFAVLAGQNVWIADRQLIRFEPQLAQSRLLPQEAVRKNFLTTAAPMRRNNILFHAFRRPGFGGVSLQAVSLENSSVLWEIELADPIVLEPRRDPQRPEQGFRIFTSAGKSYRIEPAAAEKPFLETVLMQMPHDTFGSDPLGEVLELGGGYEIWLSKPNRGDTADKRRASTGRTIMVYDFSASEKTRFRTVLLPAPLAAAAVALDGKFLAPLTDGQIVLLDPKSCRFVADPFTAPLSPGKIAAWSRPVPVGPREFLVYNNTPDAQGTFVLYRVALEGEGNDRKFVQKERIPMDAPGATPMAVLDRLAMFVDRSNGLRLFRIGREGEATRPETPDPLGKPCVWGPYRTEKAVVFATSDGQVHAVTADRKRQFPASAIPVGEPLVEPDGIVLTSAAGRLWKLDLVEGKTMFSRETGVRTDVGAFRFGNDYYLGGRDGAVYRVDGTRF